MTSRAAALGWIAFGAFSAAVAAVAVARWLGAIGLDGPVLYGEGPVANAAILARDGLSYATRVADDPRLFVAANYPPLYFRIAGIGDPFVVGRVTSIVAAVSIATAIALRARPAGGRIALALALGWIATVPVIVWGAAVKPDLLAVALTVGGVFALSGAGKRAVFAGVLLGLAVTAKPTAALPALALLAWLLGSDRRAATRYAVAAALSAMAVLAVLGGFTSDAWRHVIEWNALRWSAEQAVLLVVVAAATLGVPAALALRTRTAEGATRAYLIASAGIALLGGREGATLNYLLDFAAATALVVAPHLAHAHADWRHPLAFGAQLALALALLDPLGMFGATRTGAWGDPARIAVVREIDGNALVEDAGLVLASGRVPAVDDLFLFSRLLDRGGSFPEGARVLDAVTGRAFSAVVAETDLERLAEAPEYARQRWHPRLAAAVLEHYEFDRLEAGLRLYVPRTR